LDPEADKAKAFKLALKNPGDTLGGDLNDSDSDSHKGPNTIRLRKKSIQPNLPSDGKEIATPELSANFGIKELLASSLKVKVDKESERRKSQTREMLGLDIQNIEKKLKFSTENQVKVFKRSPSEMKYLGMEPRKQFGRKRSRSFHKDDHTNQEEFSSIVSVNSMTLEEETHKKSTHRSKHNPIYNKIYLMNNMSAEDFLDLTYELIIELKNFPGRRLLRRKSCDIEMFGGKTKNTVDLATKESKPYDLLYHHHVIEECTKRGLKNARNIQLP
jgi:hypothetical protein